MDELVGLTIDPYAAAEFEAALADHRDWLRRWHRALICGLPLEPDMIAENDRYFPVIKGVLQQLVF